METLIGLVIIFAIALLPSMIEEHTFNNRMPPPGYRVDHGAAVKDLISGKSRSEVIRKTNRGDYDIKK